MGQTITEKKKKKFELPHTMTILFLAIVLATIATYIAPAGSYDYIKTEAGTEVIDPNSYREIERTPVSPTDFMLAIPLGLAKQASVIFMLLLSMGGIQVLNESKAINAGIYKFISTRKNLELPLIAALALVFGCICAFAGWNIECVPFIPIVVAIVRSMGYDTMLGLSVVVFPAACGWSSGVINVFSTAILQGLADLPIFSGLGYRLVCFVVLMSVTLAYLLTYAIRYKKKNIGTQVEVTTDELAEEELEFTSRRKIVLAVALVGIVFMAYCTVAKGWDVRHVGGFWVLMALVLGFINGQSINEIIATFIRGLQSIVAVAIIIGMASAVLITLEKGNLMPTIIHALAGLLQHVPAPFVGVVVFIMMTFMNAVTSGVHGKAVMFMPLLAPLADILGISRQIMVLAFIFGDGFTNWFWPTAAIAVASTGAANVPMERWMKNSWKVFLLLSAVAGALVFVAYFIGYN